jgi:hypothetical protein
MRCKRCHGPIVMERCADVELSAGSTGMSALRRDGSVNICTIQ